MVRRSALPRAVRVAEEDRQSGLKGEFGMRRHFGAAIPGQSFPKLLGRSATALMTAFLRSNLGDRVFPAALAGKTATVLGDPDQPHTHTYTYLPDIGEGLAVLGEHPDAPGEVWHLPNDPDTRTTRQLVDLAYQHTTDCARCRSAVPKQSVPVSPPPMITTSRPSAVIGDTGTSRCCTRFAQVR